MPEFLAALSAGLASAALGVLLFVRWASDRYLLGQARARVDTNA